MIYDLKNIKDIRKSLHLTQSELAKKANVSQSMIAKIEAGILDPTYTKAQQIFSALDNLVKDKEIKAKDIMNKKIIVVSPETDIKDAINYMKKYEISQMPVLKKGNVVGMVSESSILDALVNSKDITKIKNIMQEAPPIINGNASFKIVSNLLKICPIVLIAEKGKLKGLITKSDLIRKLYEE